MLRTSLQRLFEIFCTSINRPLYRSIWKLFSICLQKMHVSLHVKFCSYSLIKKLECAKTWAKLPNIKFDENPFTGSTVEQMCVGKRTERRSEEMRTILKQIADNECVLNSCYS
jgi:hypothetical protein